MKFTNEDVESEKENYREYNIFNVTSYFSHVIESSLRKNAHNIVMNHHKKKDPLILSRPEDQLLYLNDPCAMTIKIHLFDSISKNKK